jgi:hypothetical protein
VRLRQLILRGIGDDFEIHLPRRGAKDPREDSITFAPITFAGGGLGSGSVELELSLREELVYPRSSRASSCLSSTSSSR